jgi:hypothetical protein
MAIKIDAIDRVRKAAMPGSDAFARSVAAVPISIVVAVVTLAFTATPAGQLLAGPNQTVLLAATFAWAVALSVAAVAAAVVFWFTWGRVIDERTRQWKKVSAAALYGAVGVACGLLVSVAWWAMVDTVPGVPAGYVWSSLILVCCVPTGVAGFATRIVLDATSETVGQVALAYVLAVVAVGVAWWSVGGYYAAA